MVAIEVGRIRSGSEVAVPAPWWGPLWVLVAAGFGTNLYFSINSNIKDPIVHWWVPVAKDVLWLAVLAFTVRRARYRLPPAVTFLVAINTLFVISELVLIQLVHGTIEMGYIRTFKNFFLYSTLTYVFVAVQARGRDAVSLIETYRLPLTLSLLGSLGLFLIWPLQSWDNRLYGTYGNPNTLGFAAILDLALVYLGSGHGRRLRQRLEITLAVLCVMLSQSLAAFLALLALLPLWHAFGYLLSAAPTRRRRLFAIPASSLPILAGAVVLVSAALWLGGYPKLRMYAIAHDVLFKHVSPQTESFTLRVDAYRNMFFGALPVTGSSHPVLAALAPPAKFVRTDGTVLAYKYHFGWGGLVILLLPFATIGLALWRARRRGPLPEGLPGLCATVAVLLLFNIPFQYQLEVFPTNFLFSSVLAAILVAVSPRRDPAFGGRVSLPEEERADRASALRPDRVGGAASAALR